MTFQVFPHTPAEPLKLASAETTTQELPELAAGAPPTMYLRIVKLAAECRPSGGPPTIRLAADSGQPVEVAEGRPVPVLDRSGRQVALAELHAGAANVERITLELRRRGSAWTMEIENNDSEDRYFTWVVADNVDEANQAWIDAPKRLTFGAEAGSPVTVTLRVANRGTGSLKVSVGGLAPDSLFSIVGRPPGIAPSDCRDVLLEFATPSKAGTYEDLYEVLSNDPLASLSPAHSNQVSLVANVLPKIEPLPELNPCSMCDCPDFIHDPRQPNRCHRCGHGIARHMT
jgi:hypothetical protein